MVNAFRHKLTNVFLTSLIELKFLFLHFNRYHFHVSFRLNHFTLLSMEPKRASNQILVRDICRETAGEHLNRHISLKKQMVWSSPKKTKGKSQETDAPKPHDLLPRWKIPISGTDNSTMPTDQRWPISFSETRRSENTYSEKTAEEKIILAFITTR
jgi:hypothetical protein